MLTTMILTAMMLSGTATADQDCNLVDGCASVSVGHTLSYSCGSGTCYDWWTHGLAWSTILGGLSELTGKGNVLAGQDACFWDGVDSDRCQTHVGFTGDVWPGTGNLCVTGTNAVAYQIGEPVVVEEENQC